MAGGCAMFRDIPIIHDLSKVMARVRIARAWLAQLSVHTAASQPFETLRPRPPLCTRPARGRACEPAASARKYKLQAVVNLSQSEIFAFRRYTVSVPHFKTDMPRHRWQSTTEFTTAARPRCRGASPYEPRFQATVAAMFALSSAASSTALLSTAALMSAVSPACTPTTLPSVSCTQSNRFVPTLISCGRATGIAPT